MLVTTNTQQSFITICTGFAASGYIIYFPTKLGYPMGFNEENIKQQSVGNASSSSGMMPCPILSEPVPFLLSLELVTV
jgi:hypothetical protein